MLAVDREIRDKFAVRAKRCRGDRNSIDLVPFYLFEVDARKDSPETCDLLNAHPLVEFAELDHRASVHAGPNDPLYRWQWSLNNWGILYPVSGGSSEAGTHGADIDHFEAWHAFAGSADIIVAIVDSGVDYNHPDLAANMWADPSGFHGYDFINDDSDPMDDFGHGTHCAGIVAAVTDNSTGISGVCPNAKIMALKFLNANGGGSTSHAAEAFYFAVANGADIISNSWGGSSSSETLREAIDYARNHGVIVVASAGNEATSSPRYPACEEGVIGVASTDSTDRRASSSNFGDCVDIAAPGVDILSLRAAGTDFYEGSLGYTPEDRFFPYGDPNAEYYISSGTSMACPHVAGVIALALSEYPGVYAEELAARALQTADDIGGLNPEFVGTLGSGRVNAHQALTMDPQPRLKLTMFDVTEHIGNDNGYFDPGETLKARIGLHNIWSDAVGVTVEVTSNDVHATVIDNGTIFFQTFPAGLNHTYDVLVELDVALPQPHQFTLEMALRIANGTDEVKQLHIEVPWPQMPGWPYEMEGEIINPVAVDLDHDGEMEIVVTSAQTLRVLNPIGELRDGPWPMRFENPSACYNGWLSIANMDGDTELEIVFVRGCLYDPDRAEVHVLNMDGSYVSGWPQAVSGRFSRIAVSDLDHDGDNEIILTTESPGTLYVFRNDGSNYGDAWPMSFADRVGRIAVSDLDANGYDEIIFSTGLSIHLEESQIHALHHDGTVVIGWPIRLPSAVSTNIVVGDIDTNGSSEIVFGGKEDNRLYLLTADGTAYSDAWPVSLPPAEPYSSTALADIDGDGRLEVLVSGRQTPAVYAFDRNGAIPSGWPVFVNRDLNRPLIAYYNGIHSVGDLDGDGMSEIVIGGLAGPMIFNHDGTPMGAAVPLPIVDTRYRSMHQPLSIAVADLDGDGDIEVISGIGGKVFVFDLPGDPCGIQWGRSRNDLGNTGAYHLAPVGLAKYTKFAACVAGPYGGLTQAMCQCQDTDSDGDVDLADFANLQISFPRP